MAAGSATAAPPRLPRLPKLLLLLLLSATARGSSAGSAYSCAKGAGLAGGDLVQRQAITLAEAEVWCLQNASCAAFTFASNATCVAESGNSSTALLASVYFQRGISSNTDGSWSFYARRNFTPPLHPAPAYRGCDMPPGSLLPWCNRSASHDERIDSLVNELNLTEKIGLLSPTKALGNPCNTHTVGAARLGLGDYMWLEESNTGVSSACLSPGHCATTFCGPLGLGASFNRTSWRLKGTVIGNEMRAMNNIGWYRDAGGTYTEKIGLTGYGPNINNPRDPRFGRLSELPSEDPVHAGTYAAEFVKGAQEEDAAGHPKMIALLKHFTAYSQETGRGHDVENISTFDLFDSFLPQYKIAFAGGASGAMCSYNAPMGRPSCANGHILKQIVREDWNFSDALITSDCGAIINLRGFPAHAPSDAAAAAWAMNNGTDIEMGSFVLLNGLADAVEQSLTTVATIDKAVRRALKPLFRVGLFDDIQTVEWAKFGAKDIGAPYHLQIRDEAASQSFVLLKNADGVLPLRAGQQHIAVVGPQSSGQGLFSDYFGDDICFGLHDRYQNNLDCVPTIASQIKALNHGAVTSNATGVGVTSTNSSGVEAALKVAKMADVVVLALGIDKTVEHEGIDRKSIELPGLQASFAKAVFALGKATVLVLTNGGPLAIDDLIDGADAIVEAFNPAFGAKQLAEALFGVTNNWGKLPYTMYDQNYTSQVSLTNYDMSLAPGRTYRYFTGKPLFEFGTGLSLTTFTHDPCSCSQHRDQPQTQAATVDFECFCQLKNTGSRSGDEVILVYDSLSAGIRSVVNGAHPLPRKRLINFARTRLDAGESTQVDFEILASELSVTKADGSPQLYIGTHNLVFSRGNGKDVVVPVAIS